MNTDETMTIDERYAYLRRMKQRYDQATRTEKGRLLQEMQTMTGLHPKSLIRLMNQPLIARQARIRQRQRSYSPQVDDLIRLIGPALDWICPERLAPALAPTARQLIRLGALTVPEEVLSELDEISISTVARIVRRLRQDEPRLPQRRGRPGAHNALAAEIPTRVIPWEESEPGHFEVDSVIHCGADTRGDSVCTIQMIDVATGWSERVAVLGRSEHAVAEGFALILARCPIPLRELHPDNGPEFLNAHLLRFFADRGIKLAWSRSRPYQHNDNRFVEQKNRTLVRAYLGDAVLKTPRQAELLDALYETMWRYYNFHQPVLRQIEKQVWHDEEGQLPRRRKHDQAQTPAQRLLASPGLADEIRQEVESTYALLNPVQLHERLERQLDALWATLKD
jgi:transposase InsO family protein